MNRLIFAMIASTFALSAAAQTGTVSPATVADHGTPAMHAAESKKNVDASKSVKGLSDTKAKQQAVQSATRVADHGTQAIHAAELQQNVTSSQGVAKAITSDKAGQEAVKSATKGATK